jgi:hypothetical protein
VARVIDDAMPAELRELLAGHQAFALAFPALGRFPELLWPAPESDGPVRALSAAVDVPKRPNG